MSNTTNQTSDKKMSPDGDVLGAVEEDLGPIEYEEWVGSYLNALSGREFKKAVSIIARNDICGAHDIIKQKYVIGDMEPPSRLPKDVVSKLLSGPDRKVRQWTLRNYVDDAP